MFSGKAAQMKGKDKMNSAFIRKWITPLLLVFAAMLCLCLPVSADMGPKPSIELKLENPPDEVYYIDLLMQTNNRNRKTIREESAKALKTEYPDELPVFEKIIDYASDGWSARLGSIRGEYERYNDKHIYSFDYSNVPKDFKVIISTASGNVIVSDECHVDAYNSVVSYDLKTGVIKEITKAEPRYISELFVSFAVTFLITLLVELIVVRKFKYPMDKRRNLLVVIFTNLATQIFLYAMIEFAGLNLVITEAIIFTVEAVIFAALLVPRYVTEGIWCALCANIISCVATLPVWFVWILGKAFAKR